MRNEDKNYKSELIPLALGAFGESITFRHLMNFLMLTDWEGWQWTNKKEFYTNYKTYKTRRIEEKYVWGLSYIDLISKLSTGFTITKTSGWDQFAFSNNLLGLLQKHNMEDLVSKIVNEDDIRICELNDTLVLLMAHTLSRDAYK